MENWGWQKGASIRRRLGVGLASGASELCRGLPVRSILVRFDDLRMSRNQTSEDRSQRSANTAGPFFV
jgi:hypothetical protein